jgi:hypothetical protein
VKDSEHEVFVWSKDSEENKKKPKPEAEEEWVVSEIDPYIVSVG